MKLKLGYRSKIALCFILLAAIVFTLLYLTAPHIKYEPRIRVLHVFYTDQSMTTTELKKSSPQNVVVINTEELKLSSDMMPFYQNNIVLECTADFPVKWNYHGYGSPHVEVHDTRKFDNFHDTTSYSYLSSLNLMPISETSSGKYTCSGLSLDDDDFSNAFVQLFVPGPKVFVLQHDITIESDMAEELRIPCQVSDPVANISLLLKGDVIEDKFIKSYKAESGFVLNAKFMEENDPLSTFLCQDVKSKRRSGKVTVSIKKDLLVVINPPSESVNFMDFNGTFSCQAKENVTLKFRKIQKFRKVQYALNLSSEFGFTVFVHFEENDLKDGSVISCVTMAQGSNLHAWTVSLSKLEEMQTIKFSYKPDTDEYACCGPPQNRPKLKKFTCHHLTECEIQQNNCLNVDSSQESKNCGLDSSPPPRFLDKGPCLHYKVDYSDGNISAGQFNCGSSQKGDWYTFVNIKSENNTVVQYSGSMESGSTLPENISDFLLGVETIYKRQGGDKIAQKYQCKGPKYFFVAGFMWQVVRYNGVLDYFVGKDHFDGAWIYSEVQFDDPISELRQAKKIYCIAPLRNSRTNFILKFTSIPKI